MPGIVSLGDSLGQIARQSALFLLVAAVLDVIYQRRRYQTRSKMTRQEVTEDRKNAEGQPLLRAKIREMQRRMGRRRMMQELKHADVVVTNPTHLAVVLRYDAQKMAAPVVVAKGQGLIAEQIKRKAREYGIPLIENIPLAHALITIDLGAAIPATMYKAVAEVLAFVYRVRRRGTAAASQGAAHMTAETAPTNSLVPKGILSALQHGEVMLALATVVIIGMMVIPLPAWVIDLLITFSLSISITVLLIALSVEEPLQFSVFPSLLLLITLFRLALNISSARLILLDGYAGQVIQAFGNFVIGGNYVVGIVVFLLLMIIQFAVITNGAGRVAEVAARFTLDAMPGKQMSIDADLNAGLITEADARRRRRMIETEADFYGAMDGASKFVKGDAIAGVAIIIVNILGGFAIGVLQKGMSLPDALQNYTLLTVGDGLVAQIPALLVSTATGIIVTRAASENGMGNDVLKQLFSNRQCARHCGWHTWPPLAWYLACPSYRSLHSQHCSWAASPC